MHGTWVGACSIRRRPPKPLHWNPKDSNPGFRSLSSPGECPGLCFCSHHPGILAVLQPSLANAQLPAPCRTMPRHRRPPVQSRLQNLEPLLQTYHEKFEAPPSSNTFLVVILKGCSVDSTDSGSCPRKRGVVKISLFKGQESLYQPGILQ